MDAPISFKKLTLLAGRAARAIASLVALTPLRFDILLTLYYEGPLIQRDLAAEFCVCRSVVSKVISALEDLDLVRRKGVEGDRRLRLVTLTSRGLTALAEMFELYGEDPCVAVQQGGELDLLRRLDALPLDAILDESSVAASPHGFDRPNGPPEPSRPSPEVTTPTTVAASCGGAAPELFVEASHEAFSQTKLDELHSPCRDARHREIVQTLRLVLRQLRDRDFTGYEFDVDSNGNCLPPDWTARRPVPVPSSEQHVAAVHFSAGIPLDAAQLMRRRRRAMRETPGSQPKASSPG